MSYPMLISNDAESTFGAGFQMDQTRLDISTKSRSSRLPWRGQFSPEFVEYIMSELCAAADVYYDPFCGSGTVLFEAIRRSKKAFGTEVNPSAWHLAVLSSFATLDQKSQSSMIGCIEKLTGSISVSNSLVDRHVAAVMECMRDDNSHVFLRLALAAIILIGMGDSSRLDAGAIERGSFAVLEVLKEVSSTPGQAQCFLADARDSPLVSDSVDAVITSPPYINVFNYHQNYRSAAELIGWQPLQAAPSEIGANRKHRQNRFLTVIQYCLDMARCIAETARIMKKDAPLVIVLGRVSNVLGSSFRNGDIISEVISTTGAFYAIKKAERSFTNRYGERIYEDILIAQRNSNSAQIHDDALREVGKTHLQQALTSVLEKNRPALNEAIEKTSGVGPSPLLSLTIPPNFAEKMKQEAF